MRIATVVACVPLLAAALGAQTPVNGRLPGEGGQGVTVKLLPPSPQTHEPLRYVLSEPAYVAVFVVYPGAGVRLLSPTIDTPERLHRGGYNTDQLIGGSFDDDIYHAVLGPTLPGPAYLYLIASTHPLDVARYVHRPTALASAIGVREARSFYTDVAFDALLNNAVALGDDASWDSDVYMLWSSNGFATKSPDEISPDGRLSSYYARILCADGSTRIVPVNYPFSGCPGLPQIRAANLAPAQVRQAASAASPPLNAIQQRVASAEAATVLPTIVGPHITDVQRRAAIERDVASQRAVYTTVANGEPVVATPQGEAGSQAQIQVIDVGSGRSLDAARRDRDAIRGEHRMQGGEELREQAGANGQNRTVGRAPQLPPNPQLAPNPVLAPAPGFPRNQNQTAAPRSEERGQREVRSEQRSAPREMPRTEQPRMAQPQPAPVVATPSASADNPARVRPGRTE